MHLLVKAVLSRPNEKSGHSVGRWGEKEKLGGIGLFLVSPSRLARKNMALGVHSMLVARTMVRVGYVSCLHVPFHVSSCVASNIASCLS